MLNRREFVVAIGAVGAAAVLPRSRAAAWRQKQSLPFEHVPITGAPGAAGGPAAHAILGDGGVVLVVRTPEGSIAVDAKFAHTAEDLAATIRGLVGEDPSILINTHHHADHTGGNWRFQRADIVAHRNLKPRLDGNLAVYRSQAEGRLSELRRSGASDEAIAAAGRTAEKIASLKTLDFMPDRHVDGIVPLELGGVEVVLHHFGNGHTDNDLVVQFPRLNIVHMGDLLFHERHPFIDRPAGANTRGWQGAVRKAMELCDEKTVVIPGHGRVTDRAALPRQIEYFDTLREIVATAMKEGRSKEEIGRMQPEVFKALEFQMLQQRALEAMHDELLAATP
jgi:glyoxylase-like metal-dependent hydrolase (beta-lactamase superfamily II)